MSRGLDVSDGTDTVKLSRLRLLSDRAGVFLYAVVRRPLAHGCSADQRPRRPLKCRIVKGLQVARVARVTGISISNGSATGTVHVTAVTAAIINRLAGKQLVSKGAVLGTATVTPSFG